ncbi:MAG: hypothetical protein ACJ8EK_09430, partial [Bradyrhizobium sp.]
MSPRVPHRNRQVPQPLLQAFLPKAQAGRKCAGFPYATNVGRFHPASLGIFLLLFNQLTKKQILAEEGHGGSDVGP